MPVVTIIPEVMVACMDLAAPNARLLAYFSGHALDGMLVPALSPEPQKPFPHISLINLSSNPTTLETV